MRNKIAIGFWVLCLGVCSAAAQTGGSRFPGISVKQLRELQSVKRSLVFPLPTWLPAGFKLERIGKKLGPRVPIYEKEFQVVYSRSVGSKQQRFVIEAGFDGLGDLPYDSNKTIRSGLGRIYLAYKPKNDVDDATSEFLDYALTEWFNVGKTAFHYMSPDTEDPDSKYVMISLADTEKILGSLQRF